MGNFVGVDLGTSFSAVAVLDDAGRPTIVPNLDGKNITPSCVMVDGGTVIVGDDARRQWGIGHNNVAARFKRDMGTEKAYHLNARAYSPTELSALVLRKIKLDTEAAIGPIDESVVTIPANFTNEAREATLAAAQDAGLKVKYIINEPTAAALYYAYKLGHELSGTYAVYDFGGGTFDVSIIGVAGKDIDVITSHGVSKLGGDDFDRALVALVAKKYKAQTGETLLASAYSTSDAEDCKRSLTNREKTLTKAGHATIEVLRTEFEAEISSLIAQAEMLCESALDEANMSTNDINGVFLVGGSTRIPAVQASVRRIFKQEPTAAINVDEVVALGAALYAAYKGESSRLSPVQKAVVGSIKFSEVTNFCFGTTVLTPDPLRNARVLKNEVLIHKNDKIPCSITKSFYTVRENQDKIDCDVTQSVSPETDPRFVKKIWKGSLPLPTGRPMNQEIRITFGFDANNVMSCSFLDVGTGRDIAVDLKPNVKTEGSATIGKFLVE